MLTKDAKIGLDYIRNADKYSDAGFVFIYDHKDINAFEGMTYEQVTRTLRYLEDEGCLKILRQMKRGWQIRLEYKGEHYEEFEQDKAQTQGNSTNINISNVNAPITGSAIGNVGTITINNGITYEEIREIIQKEVINPEDRDRLLEMISELEKLTQNEEPLRKGFFSKFSDIIKRYSKTFDAIGRTLIEYLLD